MLIHFFRKKCLIFTKYEEGVVLFQMSSIVMAINVLIANDQCRTGIEDQCSVLPREGVGTITISYCYRYFLHGLRSV